MYRRHEAVRRRFEWFAAGLTHQRSEVGTLYRATNEIHPTRASHTRKPHHCTAPQPPMHQCQSPSPVSITPAGSGPYAPTNVRR